MSDRLLIGLDVDGTLISEDETATPAVLEQVQRLQAAGHHITLATGRSWATAQRVLEHFALAPEYVVCSNGAVILQRDAADETGYGRAWVETFDPTEVLNAIRGHLPAGSFMVEDAAGHRRYTEGMTEWRLENADRVPFDELTTGPVSRVVVVAPDHAEEDFLEIVHRMGLSKVSYAVGWSNWLDIAPDGISKATALERVRTWLGIDRDRVFVAGDGRNDIDMFGWALDGGGTAIAMGQAPDEVKAAAGEVTGSIDEDGLAAVLARL